MFTSTASDKTELAERPERLPACRAGPPAPRAVDGIRGRPLGGLAARGPRTAPFLLHHGSSSMSPCGSRVTQVECRWSFT